MSDGSKYLKIDMSIWNSLESCVAEKLGEDIAEKLPDKAKVELMVNWLSKTIKAEKRPMF